MYVCLYVLCKFHGKGPPSQSRREAPDGRKKRNFPKKLNSYKELFPNCYRATALQHYSRFALQCLQFALRSHGPHGRNKRNSPLQFRVRVRGLVLRLEVRTLCCVADDSRLKVRFVSVLVVACWRSCIFSSIGG